MAKSKVAPAKLKIPRRLDEITPDWLSDALRANGVIKTAQVIRIDRQPLGEGAGFLGQLERLRLHYDISEPNAPATLIAKLPSLIRANRALAELLGAYEREIFFYQELASALPCRIPRVYYAEMDLNPLSKHTAKILAWIDRRPTWVITLIMLLTLAMIYLSRRRYALLMEDMAPAEVGDQVAGAPPERCRAALTELAGFHSAFWQSDRLDAHFWLVRQDIALKSIGLMYRRSRPKFALRFLARHPELEPYLAWLDEHSDELHRRFHGTSPHTLLHMDYRLDNLFFDDRGVTIFDWQVAGRGPGIYDAAYFIASTLEPHLGPDAERELVIVYHEALLAGGVSDYPFERCWIDYQRAMLLNLYRLASAELIEFGDERGALLIESWVARLSARVVGVDLAKIL